MNVNAYDVAVIVIIAACMIAGYKSGLIRMVFKLVSVFVSMLLAYMLYPHIGAYLRGTSLFGSLSENIVKSLNLREIFSGQAASGQAELINGLPLPAMIRDSLNNFNTPDIYELLNVKSVEDYIGGFFANIIINLIALILVFTAVMILMKLLGGVLNSVARLPVINIVNRAGGLAAGLVIGAALIWALLSLVVYFAPMLPAEFPSIDGSTLARWFLDNNIIMSMIAEVR